MARLPTATLFGVLLGGVIAFVAIVVVLQALHTKDGAVWLSVFAIGSALGAVTAIGVRRSILGSPRTSSEPDLPSRDEKRV